MQAVVIAAGMSTRTWPLTETRHKALLPLLNKPLLEHTLGSLLEIPEIKSVVIVVGHRKQEIMEHFGLKYKRFKITYVIQREQLGTGHAVLVTQPFIKGDFISMYADDRYSPKDIAKLLKVRNGALVKEVDDPSRFGVYTHKHYIAKSIVEKPKKFVSDHANIGVYKFSKEIFDYLKKIKKSSRGELEITDGIAMLLKNVDFRLEKAKDYWLPIGYPWDLLTAQEYFLEENIIGDSEVAGNAKISNSVVGDNCRIHDSAIIENSIIMDGCEIGSACFISNSILGAGCKLSSGVKTLFEKKNNVKSLVKDKMVDTGRNKFGCVLGDDVSVAMNTVFDPGVKISPGKIIKARQEVKKDL